MSGFAILLGLIGLAVTGLFVYALVLSIIVAKRAIKALDIYINEKVQGR